MGRRRLPENEVRITLSIKVRQKIKQDIMKIKGYSRIIEEMIEKYLNDTKR